MSGPSLVSPPEFCTCSVCSLTTMTRVCVCRRVRVLTEAPVHFGLIPHDHWYQPAWIDEARATAARNEMVKNQVIYGGTCVCVFRHTAHSPRNRERAYVLCPRCIIYLKILTVRFLGSVPYRNMCQSPLHLFRGVVADLRVFYVPGRYNSAFFFKHELLKDFKYYWRMECVWVSHGFSER